MEPTSFLTQIIPPARMVRLLLGEGRDSGAPLVWSSFLLRQPTEEGLLLYNTLTLELLHLPAALVPELETLTGEADGRVPSLQAGPAVSTGAEGGEPPLRAELRETLRKKWFLLPAELDQHRTVLELRQTLRDMEPPPRGLEKYTVFTTTACNARCFYCFERSWQPRSMSPETADKTADYMLAHSPDMPFRIDWFGGEPLMNRRAIDRICGRLREAGARFESAMTTNGYLFEPETLSRDLALWRLKACQITLDGTEERYNRVKNYVGGGESPYRRVLGNVHALAAAGTRVMLRMNFDRSNAGDIRALTEALIREFGGEPRVRAFASMLYEYENDPASLRTPEERAELHAIRDELMARLEAGGLHRASGLPRELDWHMCMADSGSMITVLPDGNVGLCEQYAHDHFIGNIQSPGLDREGMEAFRALHPEIPACEDCPLFPGCIPLLNCPNQICHPQRRAARENDQKRSMRMEWKRYQKGRTTT